MAYLRGWCLADSFIAFLQLIVRSLNSSLSAFASITYHSNFFDSHAIFNSRDVKGSVLVKVRPRLDWMTLLRETNGVYVACPILQFPCSMHWRCFGRRRFRH